MSAPIRLPLVIILGATGSGKSKLALEIGRLFHGEIISADSMQIYKGLDIITNKVTKEELQQCPHHMIDYLCPLQERHTVVDFRDMAVPIIDKIFQSNKIPIIVGGTNYYIEALLWKFLINKQDIERAEEETEPSSSDDLIVVSEQDTELTEKKSQELGYKSKESKKFRESLEKEDSKVLHKRLMEVDLKLAQRLHPHDKRKIIRALEVYHLSGIKMSNIHESQKLESGENSLRGPLRYENTCIFWIQAEKEVLEERINKRVDQMLERGLLKELEDFHQQYNASRIKENKEIDYTHGIFQSIGFKEFHKYLILPEADKESIEGRKLLQEGIDEMKMVTRRYAKKQTRWINNRFLRYRGSELPKIYGLDATDVSRWEEQVHNPAMEILQSVLKGEQPKQQPLPVEEEYNTPDYNVCEICGKVFTLRQEWEAHLSSKRHHKILAAKRKREKNDEINRQTEIKRTIGLLSQHHKQLAQLEKDEKGDVGEALSDSELEDSLNTELVHDSNDRTVSCNKVPKLTEDSGNENLCFSLDGKLTNEDPETNTDAV